MQIPTSYPSWPGPPLTNSTMEVRWCVSVKLASGARGERGPWRGRRWPQAGKSRGARTSEVIRMLRRRELVVLPGLQKKTLQKKSPITAKSRVARAQGLKPGGNDAGIVYRRCTLHKGGPLRTRMFKPSQLMKFCDTHSNNSAPSPIFVPTLRSFIPIMRRTLMPPVRTALMKRLSL